MRQAGAAATSATAAGPMVGKQCKCAKCSRLHTQTLGILINKSCKIHWELKENVNIHPSAVLKFRPFSGDLPSDSAICQFLGILDLRKSRAIRPFFRLAEINGNLVSEEVSSETCVFPIVPVRECKILNCEIGKPESGSSPDTCVALYRGPCA